jgi:y4mF family transcriptional regulator
MIDHNPSQENTAPRPIQHPMHDHAFQAVLAATVQRRRRELGLRQDELAELASCSTRLVHTLENGKPTLRLDKLLAVLTVLGLELAIVPRNTTPDLPQPRSKR